MDAGDKAVAATALRELAHYESQRQDAARSASDTQARADRTGQLRRLSVGGLPEIVASGGRSGAALL